MTNVNDSEEEIIVNTVNEFAIHTGQNLDNHTSSLQGKGKYVRVGSFPVWGQFRTRQEIFRFCAYAMLLSDTLPNEPGKHTFEQVLDAIRNT